MPTCSNVNDIVNIQSSVTTISVNARIDYIMRFSKHAVLVIDPLSDGYSPVASQFIDTLPDNHNAAFLSVSSNLNDIQIRCRLIEQLFNDVLFDPEESLATTILKLSPDKQQAISIVIEHAQFLSLSLLNELCQLTELANKVDRVANVLLLGDDQTGKLVVKNRVVFDNKLSILSAQTGQLIPFDSAALTDEKPPLFVKHWKSITAILTVILTLSAFFVIFLFNQNKLSSNTLEQNKANKKAATFAKQDMLQHENTVEITAHSGLAVVANKEQIASPEEIVTLLVADVKNPIEGFEKSIVSEGSASTSTVSENNNANKVEIQATSPIIVSEIIELGQYAAHYSADEDYYLALKQGYVAQIAGFSTIAAYQDFIKQFPKQDFYHYYRLLNNKKFIVVTTRVYPLATDARTAISFLPNRLKTTGVWVKQIAAINNEINAFQSSQ